MEIVSEKSIWPIISCSAILPVDIYRPVFVTVYYFPDCAVFAVLDAIPDFVPCVAHFFTPFRFVLRDPVSRNWRIL